MVQQRRQTAYKIRIKDLFSGKYVKEEGEWGPTYVFFKDKKISRVNIIANVIDKYENEEKTYGTIDLDDGTGVIKGKLWREDIKLIEDINIGDLVLVIAKVKELSDDRHLMLEVIKVLKNSSWAEIRKLELNGLWGVEARKFEEEIVEQPTVNSRQKVLSLIEKFREINEEEILNKLDLNKEEIFKIVNELIKEGEIYRPTPGCLRIV